jgi:hypothetical protein
MWNGGAGDLSVVDGGVAQVEQPGKVFLPPSSYVIAETVASAER